MSFKRVSTFCTNNLPSEDIIYINLPNGVLDKINVTQSCNPTRGRCCESMSSLTDDNGDGRVNG